MNYNFSAKIPVIFFDEDMESIPSDGTPVFVLTDSGEIDLARKDRAGWTSEFGADGGWIAWSYVSIFNPPNRKQDSGIAEKLMNLAAH